MKKMLVHMKPEVIKLEIDSYRGGRNECFFIGEAHGEFYKLDVNSMYPYVMATHYYPIKCLK